MTGTTSQPNLNSLVAALREHDRETRPRPRRAQRVSDYWERCASSTALRHRAARRVRPRSTSTRCRAGSTRTSRSRPRRWGWPSLARDCADVRRREPAFGDIVKVTPEQGRRRHVLYLVTRGIRPRDVPTLTPGSHDFPASVIDMLQGGLGQPDGGWPAQVQKVVLGDRVPTTTAPRRARHAGESR